MKAINFPQSNVVFAKDQPEYLPLPSHKTESGLAVFCWQLSWRDILRVIFTHKIWHIVLVMDAPLQPQHLQTEFPFPGTDK